MTSCDVLQVVERLEADLGVTVEEVRPPELRYGFQIWSTYMGLPDQEGNVGPPVNLIHDQFHWHTHTHTHILIGRLCTVIHFHLYNSLS